ncbi:hypothetical protein OESDEN_17618, partial [Oesophagostomum dentatum]
EPYKQGVVEEEVGILFAFGGTSNRVKKYPLRRRPSRSFGSSGSSSFFRSPSIGSSSGYSGYNGYGGSYGGGGGLLGILGGLLGFRQPYYNAQPSYGYYNYPAYSYSQQPYYNYNYYQYGK